MTKNKFYKLSGLVLTLSIAIGSSTYAATQNTTTHHKGTDIKTQLSTLVTAGTITQAQEDAAITTITADRPQGDHKGGPGAQDSTKLKASLDALVTAGTITQV